MSGKITLQARCAIKLILSSSSPYRRELLERLLLPFTVRHPEIDETPRDGEMAQQLVIRLSLAKANAVSRMEPQAIIIGSDQAATLDDRILGKPGTPELARRQLRELSGRSIRFHTGLCVLNSANGDTQTDCVHTDVYFRRLSDEEITRYLEQEQPYDCAGSFKSERLGITLLERMEGTDPTALIGLPLLCLCSMLRRVGYKLP